MDNIVTYKNKTPKIDPSAYINPYAIVIGDVSIAEGVSLWPGVIIRADDDRIEIGANTAILDKALIEAPSGYPVHVGADVLISHSAVLHGCTVSNGVLIGISANVLEGSEIGEESVVGALALITANTKIPARKKAMGMPAKVTGEVTDNDITKMQEERKKVHKKAEEYGQWFVTKQS